MTDPHWMALARYGRIRLNAPADDGGGSATGGTDSTDAADDDNEPLDGEEALGDPGKKALDAMRAKERAARERARVAEEERDRLKAASEGREAEWEAERKTHTAAEQRFNERVLKAELKAVAVGRLEYPDLVDKHIDLTDFEVSEDGDVDTEAITAAVDALIEKYPRLAAQGEPRFKGSADAGVRKGSGIEQLTKADLARLTPQQIEEARKKGQLDNLLGRKP